jgi:hypothetical protein
MLKTAQMLYDVARQHRGGFMKKSDPDKVGPKKRSN